MRNIIFLDLDGPMIPWWGIDCKDETGKGGKVLSEFPFFSRMHPEAINSLRIITEATNSVVVTNSTHNGGYRRHRGAVHIRRIFEANGIGNLLLNFEDLDNPVDAGKMHLDVVATAFKNPDFDVGCGNRAQGIIAWFNRWDAYIDNRPAFLAIDDANEDIDNWNSEAAPEALIPFLYVGNFLNPTLTTMAIDLLQDQPNYVAKK